VIILHHLQQLPYEEIARSEVSLCGARKPGASSPAQTAAPIVRGNDGEFLSSDLMQIPRPAAARIRPRRRGSRDFVMQRSGSCAS
jgi:hypothetical protein